MSEPKKYRLVTIADAIDVLTDDNIDNFLVDFKMFVKTTQNLCDLGRFLIPEMKDKKYSEIGQAIFNWIDDGKHESTGGLRVTDPETGEDTDFPLDLDVVKALADEIRKETNA